MTTEETRFNAGARRLCPDGSCLGLVGEDGRCNVCGRTASGERGTLADASSGGASADAGDGGEPSDFLAADSAAPAGAESAPAPPAGDFDPTRRLCDDGACVGVVGPDGACGVCGRVAS